MATATATVYIGKTELKPYHVHIEQRFDWHHLFEVTVSTEKAGVMDVNGMTPESVIIDNALAYVGEFTEIIIERPAGTCHFKGFVTDVQVEQTYAGDAFIIFKGFSPTYMLDGQKSVASFEEMTLQDIFNKVTTGFPENVKKEVNPKYTEPILYVTRYKETQYQFLNRMAATYGEWFYYDGQQLVFGDLPSNKKEITLNFGSDSMLSFNYGINLRPTSFKQQFYKYGENKTLEKSVAGFEPGWLDSHSKQSHKVSKEFFQEEGIHPVIQGVKDDKQINYMAEARKSAMLSDVMVFNGQSADPGISIGAEVEVHSKKGFIGKYRVTSVTHNFNSNRDYNNVFEAIPVSSVVPPVNRSVFLTEAESQIAEVVDNNDPDQLGRVRVKFKWQEGMTPWIRVLTNHAGKDDEQGVYGTYFIPEIGDEVYVDFEQGNPDRPFVMGSKYHSKTQPGWFDPENNQKAIKTRSGHTILLNDEKGKESITILDKKGNVIHMDTTGESISISSEKAITISSKDISIVAKNDVNISAGNNINISAKTNVLINGENEANMLGAKAASLASGSTKEGGSFDGSALSLSPSEAGLVGKSKVSVGGDDEASVGSKKVTVVGASEVTVAGGMVKLN